ncbi:MAG: DUF2780 domain-containing protein [Ignavibacteriaceae bacterium]|nr:DUF2780 domain-containing protein [Ignavibacteriaceae bacterium]
MRSPKNKLLIIAISSLLLFPGCAALLLNMLLPNLIGVLAEQLGVTESQAKTATGAIMIFTKGSLEFDDFKKLTGLIPGADEYINQAESVIKDPMGTVEDLTGALIMQGLPKNTVETAKPILGCYLRAKQEYKLADKIEKILTPAVKPAS